MLYALTPVRTVAPTETPVSLSDAKAHLRVEQDETADDALISALIAAATERLDGWSGILGRCMVTQTWRFDFPAFPAGDYLRLPMGKVQSLAVSYRDADGAAQTLSSALYRVTVDALGPVVALNDGETWPATETRPEAVSVTAVLGYGVPEDVPAPLKAAILLMVGDLWRFTETATTGAVNEVPMSMTVSNLIAPYRAMWF